MLIQLSYHLSEQTPFYSMLAKPRIERLYDLDRGDACNSSSFTTSNHCGTHVDAPRHFCADGRPITSYAPDELAFTAPALLDVAVTDCELITPQHLTACSSLAPESDLLLLRTGFGVFRHEERRYVDRAPGFSAAAAQFLMERFTRLRALAVDFVSISALEHEQEGAAAHRVFLGCGQFADRPILLIEDARIPDPVPAFKRVILAPWMLEGLDSAPCTLLGEVADA
ncbi:MAG: cyclase family protein [Acidobacteria bacterium]|nr:cyclase family protein [Acidobacteriota bacterium]